jgi:serine/threonine-protein kinase SRPK3
MITDYGQSYVIANLPRDYQPGTVLNYLSPETRFEGRTGSFFDSFFSSNTDILRQTVETLGRLPDPWWSSFEERTLWFEEDGEPKSAKAQKHAVTLLQVSKSSIRARLCSIGQRDDPPYFYEGPMVENSGVRR